MDVSLKVVGKNDHDLDLWGYDKIYADDYSIGDTVYEVTVPDGSVVTVNGHTLTDADIAKDENGDPKVSEIADLKVISQYLDYIPSFVTYAVKGFIVEPPFVLGHEERRRRRSKPWCPPSWRPTACTL